MLSKIPRFFLLYLLLPVSVFLTFNKHSRIGQDHYRNPIFADAAGYNAYLPYFFIPAEKILAVDSLSVKTGNGFSYTASGVLQTKYPMGVAILQLPFFLTAHLISPDADANGYSSFYRGAVNVAGVTYGWLGLVLLALVLKRRFPEWISFTVPLLLFAGTNLYWYMIDGTGMSHVYDFFLASLFLFLIYRFMEQPSFIRFVLLSTCASFLILVRPMDFPVLLMIFYAGVRGRAERKQRLIDVLGKPLRLVAGVGIAFLVWIPQMLYWKHAQGSYFHYSYTGESFENWASPYFFHVLFSTKNGWLLYSPLIILALAGTLYYIRKGYREGRGILVVTLLVTYLAASWHSWMFGCAYGGRSFIVLYPFLAVGLAWLIMNISSIWSKIIFTVLVIVFIAVNIDMIYYYDGCFYGNNWDLAAYFRLLNK
ncbi:MAG: hypothetical protein IT233_12390 [Bacteroidia bacterium]|nr:hypothetical protein [Bacteroidia bacterium]